MLIKKDAIKIELVIVYIDSLKVLWVIIYILIGIAFIAGFFYKRKIIKKRRRHRLEI